MKSFRPLLQLTSYYILLFLLFALLLWLFPDLVGVLPLGGLESLVSGMNEFMTGKASLMNADPLSQMVALSISLVAVLLLMEPVAWTYVGARRKKGREQSFVITIVLLPVVVAGIVLIVQNSLALAFSLAGIVAAVRFRLTLEDSLDAIYIFVAIGAGLAAGIQAIEIALVTTVFFNYLIVIFWMLDYGEKMASKRWFSRRWKAENVAIDSEQAIDD